jgi:guanylate kinase
MQSVLVLFALMVALLGVSPVSQASSCADAFSNTSGVTVGAPRLLILSAPSGGGKTTLAQMLLKTFSNLALSVSSTTRAPRGQEVNGKDYHFLKPEDFKARIAEGRFAEWAEVHGNYYGTDIETIRSEFALGHSVLALVDIKGAENLKKSFPGEVFTIFITPPDMKTLEARLRGRGTDSEEAIQLRLANARKEMAEAPRFDKVIVNDDLDQAHRDLADLLRRERLVP